MYIRPLLEYASPVLTNMSKKYEHKLDRCQNEALLIITGCKPKTSVQYMANITGITTLSNRRKLLRLTALYNIVHQGKPEGLYNCIPKWDQERPRRDPTIIKNIRCKTEAYRKTFLPQVIREWNSLPMVVRESESVEIFKRGIHHRPAVEKQFFEQLNRSEEKIINQLWTKNSNLNAYRYKIGQSETPCCSWCLVPETNHHYLLVCDLYSEERRNHTQMYIDKYNLNEENIIKGSLAMSDKENQALLRAVCDYINDTKRMER